MRGVTTKSFALITSAVLALFVVAGVAAVLSFSRPPEGCPLELTLVKIRPAALDPGLREVTLLLSNPGEFPLAAIGPPNIELKKGAAWTVEPVSARNYDDLTPRHLKRPERMTLFVTRSTEMVRLHYDYVRWWRLPLGLGSPVARERPPSRVSAWTQRVISKVSARAYDWLWPKQSRLHWKSVDLEVPLPKNDTTDEFLARANPNATVLMIARR